MLDLKTVWQGAEVSSAVVAKPQSFLLSFGVFCPGEGERGGEEEPSLQAPVSWVLGADRWSNGGRSDGGGTLQRDTRGQY